MKTLAELFKAATGHHPFPSRRRLEAGGIFSLGVTKSITGPG